MANEPERLVELGQRYAAQGLNNAALAVFERALSISPPDDPSAARRLAELCLARGDGRGARRFAAEVAKREPGPVSQLLLGRAQLAAGELDGARFSFASVVDQPQAGSLTRIRAMVGRARVAALEHDLAGAAANCMAGIDELVRYVSSPERDDAVIEREIAVVEDLLIQAVALDRAADAGERIDELAALAPGPANLMKAVWLSARQAQGDDSVSDREIDRAYGRELEQRPHSRPVRIRRAERALRRRYRDPRGRKQAVADLERMRVELDGRRDREGPWSHQMARILFLLAAAYEDDPGRESDAEECFRRGLALQPGHATAANQLVRLLLARGAFEEAITEIERALRIDAGHGLAWRSAVRLLDALGDQPEAARRILEAARPGAGMFAGALVPSLLSASAEVARDEVLGGMFARGHRLKNLLSIIASRARSVRKLAGESNLGPRLASLEDALTALYDEWAAYLRSMHTTPVVETVPVSALLREVVDDARAGAGDVVLDFDPRSGIPDLRGDRVLLREALSNIVVNAVQACAPRGRVSVSVRMLAAERAPVVEISVVDTGPGIPRAALARVFVPGYTTKDSGSGIGLSIAERVVAAHHGRIVVETEPGQGTLMRVMLPCDMAG